MKPIDLITTSSIVTAVACGASTAMFSGVVFKVVATFLMGINVAVAVSCSILKKKL